MRNGLRLLGGRRQAFWAWVFLTPGLLYFVIFLILPVMIAIYVSFTDWDIMTAPRWVGWENYTQALQDKVVIKAINNTVHYALVTIPITMLLGLSLALALNESFRGRVLFRTIYYLPVVVSIAAAGMVWVWIYQPQSGILNHILQGIGLPPQSWLTRPKQALAALMPVGIWQSVGWCVVVYLAGLQGIASIYYEAAMIDGAGAWRRFWNITWPMLGPTTLFVFVMEIIGALQVFGAVYVMTGGGPLNSTTVIVHQVYIQGFEHLRMGYASAIGMLLFVIILALSLANLQLMGRRVEI